MESWRTVDDGLLLRTMRFCWTGVTIKGIKQGMDPQEYGRSARGSPNPLPFHKI